MKCKYESRISCAGVSSLSHPLTPLVCWMNMLAVFIFNLRYDGASLPYHNRSCNVKSHFVSTRIAKLFIIALLIALRQLESRIQKPFVMRKFIFLLSSHSWAPTKSLVGFTLASSNGRRQEKRKSRKMRFRVANKNDTKKYKTFIMEMRQASNINWISCACFLSTLRRVKEQIKNRKRQNNKHRRRQ